jgi:uncharacterized protein (TIGR04551 family)
MRILSRFSPNSVRAARALPAPPASEDRSKAGPGGWVLALPVAVGILLAPLSIALAQPGPPPAAAPPSAAPVAPPAPPPAVPAPPPPSHADEPLMPVAPPPSALPPPPPPPTPPSAAITIDPDRDAKVLGRQGTERPIADGNVGNHAGEVYAEDWWSQARPVFEIHGYYRVRSELFYNFALGRVDNPSIGLWPQPADNDYIDSRGQHHIVNLCGPTSPTVTNTSLQLQPCHNETQAGANMRFRINPELHISDNLRILSQIDLLDNLVLGSTPDGYANEPAGGGSAASPAGYAVVARGGYSPLGVFSTTQWAPVAGVNSPTNSITVKRVWGEYQTPVGLLRFGRMPNHWGLGMLANSGDGYDSDYGDTSDRIMFITGIKKYGLYAAGAWDFVNGGPINATPNQQQGQPTYDSQLNNVNQWVLVVVRREDPELQKIDLAHGKVVINGGLYFVYRNQFLASDDPTTGSNLYAPQAPSQAINEGFVRRGAQAGIPDLWLQFLYKKFRFEAEGAMIYGSLENIGTAGTYNYANPADPSNPGWQVREFGVATQSEFKAIEDRLDIQFGFGWASGDPNQKTLAPIGTDGLTPPVTASRTFSEFAFNPDYRVDMIFYRNILTRVEGSYYFRPSVDYDFLRDKNGQRLGGGAALIWSRASEFIQAPGHQRDLGLELNFQIYFQSRDGTLNDNPDKMGGFYTALQYGVLFPLGGLGYLPGQVQNLAQEGIPNASTSTAQILRWYLGILF